MAWSFVVTDLNGVVHGELLRARERKVALPHLRVPSASCQIQLEDPLAATLATTDCLLKCYRTDNNTGQKNLAFIGPVVSTEEDGSSQGHTLAVTAAGPYWRMAKRIIPASKLQSGVQYGSPSSLAPLGQVAHDIIVNVNGENFTGIQPNGSGMQTATTQGWVGLWHLKNAAEGIAELAAGLNTFEFRVNPTEPTLVGGVGGWPQIGTFQTAQTLGVSRPDAIFEYGTTRANVMSYKRLTTRDGMLTNALISVQGWPDTVERDAANVEKYHMLQRAGGVTIAPPTAPSSADITARGLFEEVVDDAGILDDTVRAGVADYHVLIRKQPRQIITFFPAPNARPAPFVDYNVGDTVRGRAVVAGTLRFDALFRIWGISFEIDENGNETVSLELVTP